MPSPTPYLKATLVFVVALTALAFFIWLQAPLMGVLFAGQVVFFSSLADRWKVVVALALVAVSAAVVITWLPDLLPDLLLSTLPLGALAIVYLVSRTSLADRWQMVVALALVAVFAAVVITFLPDTRLFILLFGTLFGALVIVQIMDPVFFAIRQQAAFAFAAMAVSGLVFITWSPLLHLLTRLSDLPSRLVNVLPQPLADLVPRDPPMESLLWALGFACALVAAVFVASPSDRRPRLQLGGLILAAWTVASLAVAVITLLIWHALGAPPLEPVTELSPRDVNSIATRAFAVIAGLGGVALLVISYRRQRTTEADGQRAEKAAGREDTKLFNERFTTAYTELGSEHAAVRLGAVHALARAADNAPTGRDTQMVIEVLCAYLRMPYTPAPEEPAKNASKAKKEEHRERELEFESFREVRHTVIRIIGDRLREVTRWRSQDYDFTGVVFDGGDLTGANFHFGKVSFRKARFTKGTMDFSGAEFDGGTVDFSGAEF
ncbi:Pentapeptide repeat-containing protein, partial [Nocardiopsis flavescens]